MNRPVKVGVAGVGSLGFHHARILRDVPGAVCSGIFDADAERCGAVGSELGLDAHATLDALIAASDAIIVAVPTTAHEDVACAALRAGVHVLVEKPMAPTLEAADRMLEAAQASGCQVQIGHVERFNPILRACEPYLDEPIFVETHRLAPFGPRGTDVTVVLDLMIHDLDLLLAIVNRPVSRVAAVGVPVLTPSPDIANARLEFEGGAVANLTASRVSMERMRKIRFFQRSGYISLDLASGKGEFLRLKPGVQLGPGSQPTSGGLADIIERISLTGDGKEPLRAELESFVAALSGKSDVVVTGEQARQALAVALEIIQLIDQRVALTAAL